LVQTYGVTRRGDNEVTEIELLKVQNILMPKEVKKAPVFKAVVLEEEEIVKPKKIKAFEKLIDKHFKGKPKKK
jgi:hypothetical protein